jgi:hypothetical protein
MLFPGHTLDLNRQLSRDRDAMAKDGAVRVRVFDRPFMPYDINRTAR